MWLDVQPSWHFMGSVKAKIVVNTCLRHLKLCHYVNAASDTAPKVCDYRSTYQICLICIKD